MALATLATISGVAADAHARRVTLNMVLHSNCCPAPLRAVVQKLSDDSWDWSGLTRVEAEVIFGAVDADLCRNVLSEYEVDTSTIRDWGFPWRSWSKADAHDWWTGVHEVDCRLCGHKHNRFELLAKNTAGGGDIWMGTTCIRKYGIVVDGAATAEAAWDRLRVAINHTKEMQSRWEWVAEYGAWIDNAIDRMERGLEIADKHVPYRMWKVLPSGWQSATRLFRNKANGAIRFYRKRGYLTAQRTHDVWSVVEDGTGAASHGGPPKPSGRTYDDGWLVKKADELVKAWADAEVRDPHKEAERQWDKFVIDYPRMNSFQRGRVDRWRQAGWREEDLTWGNSDLVAEIRKQHAADAKTAVADNTDLPF